MGRPSCDIHDRILHLLVFAGARSRASGGKTDSFRVLTDELQDDNLEASFEACFTAEGANEGANSFVEAINASADFTHEGMHQGTYQEGGHRLEAQGQRK